MLVRSLLGAVVLQSCNSFILFSHSVRKPILMMSTTRYHAAEKDYSHSVICKSEEDIESLGYSLAEILDVGDVLLLKG